MVRKIIPRTKDKKDSPLTPKQKLFAALMVSYGIQIEGKGRKNVGENGFCAGDAYIKAGFKAKNKNTAKSSASQLLGTPKIKEEIIRLQKEALEKVEKKMAPQIRELKITTETILAELAAIAFSDIGDIVDLTNGVPRMKEPGQIPEHARRALSAIKVRRYTEGHGDDAREVEMIEFRHWDKVAALDKLAKRLQLYPSEKVKIEGEINHTVNGTVTLKPNDFPEEMRKQLLEVFLRKENRLIELQQEATPDENLATLEQATELFDSNASNS